MAVRTLDIALWDYQGHDGRHRRAFRGEQLDLTDDEAERGDRAGAFLSSGDDTPLPRKTSTNSALVTWLVEHRAADRDAIKLLTKPELWDLINKPQDA